MKIKRLLLGALAAVMACGVSFAQYNVTKDDEGYPVMYIKGTMTNNWSPLDAYRFTRTGENYTLTLASLDGEFKISAAEWDLNYGTSKEITESVTVTGTVGGGNFSATGLKDVTISFSLGKDNYPQENDITFTVPGGGGDDPDPVPGPATGMSGTLPVLYINVYTDTLKTTLNNEIISRDLDHKNYFSNAEYWLDVNGCQWLIDQGALSVGSAEEPLALEIKARGNFTRKAFAKKPFKLKLEKKQSLLGLSKSKHFAILAHADDDYGYLRNFTGFNLGKRMGLPWTPWQQPVEVVINGDYRGLYFLTESIRVGDGRVPAEELDDNCMDPALLSGGYLVELDNYDEDNQIQMEEKSCAWGQTLDKLRITWDTPEEYSELQKRFVTEQFTAMNDAVGRANQSDDLWKYMDMDDAARYYLVEEIISHWEAYHGSTYLFRDRGEGKKWRFSPLWDCGNAFNGASDRFFYNCDEFGNTWIPSMRENASFNAKVSETWKWFMKNKYSGLEDEMRAYADHLKEAAKADRARWKDAPRPAFNDARDVVDNTDMDSKLAAAVGHLNAKTAWLKTQFGEYADASGAEPARDNTEAAPLPDYAKPGYDPYTDYPEMYVRGTMTGGDWAINEAYKMTREGKTYTITLESLDGDFKVANSDWTVNYGPETPVAVSGNKSLAVKKGGENITASGLQNVTISFELNLGANGEVEASTLVISVPEIPATGMSGTLPVLYINVYTDDTKTEYNNEVIDKDLSHKDYFSNAEYWLDVNDCQWLIDEGAASIGSKEEPLPLEIKARGNFTRQAYAKKPFKLKLGEKQSLLGLSKSKHFAILAHADDNFGYLRNFTGFWLGRRIGLPWTPWQQPVEVVINNNYRGLYFLTESIRIEKARVNITELDDLVDDRALVSGGYLVELDNYPESNQISMEEKGCVDGWRDQLRVTWDTPEDYSETQKRFVTEQFSAMNDAVGSANTSDELWRYMDLDDAARYYLVEEIISHYEAYHGSTYLFRDHGNGQKWHFSPLWDCGHAFDGATDRFLYNNDGSYGNTWIPSIRQNSKFNDKVKATWLWFMNNGYTGLKDAMTAYVGHIAEAAKADRARWKDAPMPVFPGGTPQPVVDNTDMQARLDAAIAHLDAKTAWLKGQFGDYAAVPEATEPERDTTEAAPLPSYADPDAPDTSVNLYYYDHDNWNEVYAYIWGGGDDVNVRNDQMLGPWPGKKMREEPIAGARVRPLALAETVRYYIVNFEPTAAFNDKHMVIFNNGSSGTGNETKSFLAEPFGTYSNQGIATGIDSVTASEPDAAPEYYSLQGIRVAEPRRGEIYIRVKGGSADRIRY